MNKVIAGTEIMDWQREVIIQTQTPIKIYFII